MDPAEHAAATQRRARDPKKSFWVVASAGSGKTKLLCDRVVSLLCHGAKVSSILCLTYTRAAAEEMRTRVLSIIQRLAAGDPDYQDLRDVLTSRQQDPHSFGLSIIDQSHQLAFYTIHGFAERLLRQFPLEAGVSPDFHVLEEQDAQRLLQEAAESLYESMDYDEEARVLASVLHDRYYTEVFNALLERRHALYEALAMSEEAFLHQAQELLELDVGLEKYEDVHAQWDATLPQGTLQRIADFLSRAQDTKDNQRMFEAFCRMLSGNGSHNAYRLCFLTTKNEPRRRLVTKSARLLEEDQNILKREAERLAQIYDQKRKLEALRVTKALRRAASHVWAQYNQRKQDAQGLDFDDLLDFALRLWEDDQLWVQYRLDGRFQHILVDEAQDTNVHQWRLIHALTQKYYRPRRAR